MLDRSLSVSIPLSVGLVIGSLSAFLGQMLFQLYIYGSLRFFGTLAIASGICMLASLALTAMAVAGQKWWRLPTAVDARRGRTVFIRSSLIASFLFNAVATVVFEFIENDPYYRGFFLVLSGVPTSIAALLISTLFIACFLTVANNILIRRAATLERVAARTNPATEQHQEPRQ